MAEQRRLDETDLEIVELLAADARRSFRDIAEHVDLSPPAVSDRVDRLTEQGIIRRFTVDLDRSVIRGRTRVLVEVRPKSGTTSAAFRALSSLDGVEHAFQTADGAVLAYANAPTDDVGPWLEAALADVPVRSRTVRLVDAYGWQPTTERATFALTCVVCGNDVGTDGVTAAFDGEPKAFCCPSCEARYREEYAARTGGA